jgi:hypothetical protein
MQENGKRGKIKKTVKGKIKKNYEVFIFTLEVT